MSEIINFFKDILMIKEDNSLNIGLTQLKTQAAKTGTPKINKNAKKELKLSDLMRGNIG